MERAAPGAVQLEGVTEATMRRMLRDGVLRETPPRSFPETAIRPSAVDGVLETRSGIAQWSPDTSGLYVPRSLLTAKGDLVGRDASGVVRKGVGADSSVLVADSVQADGLRWETRATVAALPGSPVEGQECRFQTANMLSNGFPPFLLRYTSGAWHGIGSCMLTSESGSAMSSATLGAWQLFTSPPGIICPLTGVYDLLWGHQGMVTAASAGFGGAVETGIAQGGTVVLNGCKAGTQGSWPADGTYFDNAARAQLSTLNSGSLIDMRWRTDVIGGGTATGYCFSPWMRMRFVHT